MTHDPPQASPIRSPGRRAVAALVVLLVWTLLALPAPAQDFRLQGLRGGQLSEGDLAQGATIVVVWASWSPRGRDIAQRVAAIQSRWGSRARVVTVNFQEDKATVEQFLSGKNLGVPVYLDVDGTFSKKHAITTLPGLLVIRDGNVAYRGKLPENPDQVLSEALG